MVAYAQRAGVVEFHRIRHRQEWSGPRSHPDRLVIDRPVGEMGEALLLREIGCRRRLDGTGAHPSGRSDADVFGDDLDALANVPAFIVFPQTLQGLGVGAAMAEDVVTTLFD